MREMRNNPCRGCGDRRVGCHGECERYIDAVARYREEGERIRAAKDKEQEYRSFKRDCIERWRKVEK